MWLYLVELKDDAADAPDVAGLRPAQLEDDLRGAVVPRRHHRAVVLPVERRRAEVDQLHPVVVGAARRSTIAHSAAPPARAGRARPAGQTNSARNQNKRLALVQLDFTREVETIFMLFGGS